MTALHENLTKRLVSIEFLLNSHSTLAHYYQTRADWIRYFQAGLAIILVILLIPDVKLLAHLIPIPFPMWLVTWLKSGSLACWLLLLSLMNFALYVVSLELNFAGRAEEHRRAVKHYFQVKCFLRKGPSQTDEEITKLISELEAQYSDDADIPKVPPNKYLKLKNKHLTEEALKKDIEANPGACIWIRWIRLLVTSTFRSLLGKQ